MQTIEMIMSLYRNNVPMRFGVILYSSKMIKKIEDNGGELPILSAGKNDRVAEDDLSSLVIFSFMNLLLLLVAYEPE